MNRIATITAAALIAGCATNPDKIDAAYVSPTKYADLDCQQLAAERVNIERRTLEVKTKAERKHKNDSTKMGVGLLLFWPTLFFISGDGPEAAEYAQLQGEARAIREAATSKHCYH